MVRENSQIILTLFHQPIFYKLLSTKKFNPITAILQPSIGKGCNTFQPRSLIAFPRTRCKTKMIHQVMRETLITSFVFVSFCDLPAQPLRFSFTFEVGFIIFLGDKRLDFLSCLISEAQNLRRKKPRV